MKANVLNLSSIGDLEVGKVGGKAANLSTLIKAGSPVPPGIVVEVGEYELFLDENGLRDRISSLLSSIDFYKARVVESIERLGDVKDNEILVTSNTDPGWTAVFSKIGGLITETGGYYLTGPSYPANTASRRSPRLTVQRKSSRRGRE